MYIDIYQAWLNSRFMVIYVSIITGVCFYADASRSVRRWVYQRTVCVYNKNVSWEASKRLALHR